MVNGAPGSAWASLRCDHNGQTVERLLIGTPSNDDATPLDADHLFDLASLTKVLTTVAALQLVDAGIIDPDAPVSEVLAVGRGPHAEQITLRQLLTHTSGLPADSGLWRQQMAGEALRERLLRSRICSSPGLGHRYSDVGFVAVGEILEQVSGTTLEALIDEVARSIGAESLTWNPDPMMAVATEDQPHRGPVRGEVHDELAHALARPAGHAGLFGSLDDVASLARMIRDGGAGIGGRVLSEDSIRLMSSPVTRAETGYGQAVGLRVRDEAWMGDVDAIGHTGFTGTCFAVLPASGEFGVLLVNRVHPSRVDADIAAIRRDFVRGLVSRREVGPGLETQT